MRVPKLEKQGHKKLVSPGKKEVSFWREGVSVITCLCFLSEGSVRGCYVELHEITLLLRDCPFKRETPYPFWAKKLGKGAAQDVGRGEGC